MLLAKLNGFTQNQLAHGSELTLCLYMVQNEYLDLLYDFNNTRHGEIDKYQYNLPIVTVGNNIVIGACSVVTKNIPDNVILFGVHCKVQKEIEPNIEDHFNND